MTKRRTPDHGNPRLGKGCGFSAEAGHWISRLVRVPLNRRSTVIRVPARSPITVEEYASINVKKRLDAFRGTESGVFEGVSRQNENLKLPSPMRSRAAGARPD